MGEAKEVGVETLPILKSDAALLARELPGLRKVLLVDDEPRVCAALAGALISEGYEVVFVESGDEALDAFRRTFFDLVLLDLRMPGKDGWETLALLKAARPLLPIIIITALPDQQTVAAAAGVGALLEKPLEIKELLQTMQQLLAAAGLSKSERSIQAATLARPAKSSVSLHADPFAAHTP